MNEITTTNSTNNLINSFEGMYRVAEAMSASSLIPKTLQGSNAKQTTANCLRVVEQAQRWGLSPFAVMDCASVVHGKLMWEGKLIAAALEATLGIRLNYKYSGSGASRKVVVSGKFADEDEVRTVEGAVKDWKTSQWKDADMDQRLAYRGAREWARRHHPASILGVYSTDEMETQKEVRNVTRQQVINPEEQFKELQMKMETKPVEPQAEPVEAVEVEVEGNDDDMLVTLADYTVKEGVSKGKPWKLHIISISADGKVREAKTFSDTIGNLAQDNIGKEAYVTLDLTPKNSLELVTLRIK